METKSFILDFKNYKKDGQRGIRVAVRGIIKKGDKYAMVYNSKHGYYEFPGGGMEVGEKKEDTLIREVKEEIGLTVIPSSIKSWGVVREIRKGLYEDILDMTSYYYICEVEDEIGKCSLDKHEVEDGFQLRFVTIEEAIKNNESAREEKGMPWITRDIEVMKKL